MALVPEEAIRTENGQSVAFVLTGNQVERRAVKVGGHRGEQVEVAAGLRSGERVVVDGPPELADGDRVTVKE